MSISLELPALGESVVEGTVARWLVQEGEAVALMPPEATVGFQIVGRLGDRVHRADSQLAQPLFGLPQQILESDRVLLNLTTGPLDR